MNTLRQLMRFLIARLYVWLLSRKEKVMNPEENLPDAVTSGGGGVSTIEAVGMPG